MGLGNRNTDGEGEWNERGGKLGEDVETQMF